MRFAQIIVTTKERFGGLLGGALEIVLEFESNNLEKTLLPTTKYRFPVTVPIPPLAYEPIDQPRKTELIHA